VHSAPKLYLHIQRVSFAFKRGVDTASSELDVMCRLPRPSNGERSHPVTLPTLNQTTLPLNSNWRSGSLNCFRLSLTYTTSFPTCARCKIDLNYRSVHASLTSFFVSVHVSIDPKSGCDVRYITFAVVRDRERLWSYLMSDPADLKPAKKIRCNALSVVPTLTSHSLD